MIDPALDGWVWATAALFLVLIGVRAWVVERGAAKVGNTQGKVKVLTAATVAVLLGLAVLLTVQGGALLAQSLITGTDPTPTTPAEAPPPAAPAAPPG